MGNLSVHAGPQNAKLDLYPDVPPDLVTRVQEVWGGLANRDHTWVAVHALLSSELDHVFSVQSLQGIEDAVWASQEGHCIWSSTTQHRPPDIPGECVWAPLERLGPPCGSDEADAVRCLMTRLREAILCDPALDWERYAAHLRTARAHVCQELPDKDPDRKRPRTEAEPGLAAPRERVEGPCCVTGCGETTALHPMCATHAREILGIEVRTSRIPEAGNGVFAVRELPVYTVVCPYLGELRLSDDTGSRYVVEGPDKRLDLDGEFFRSYGSTINHQPPRHTNCKLRWSQKVNVARESPQAIVRIQRGPLCGFGIPKPLTEWADERAGHAQGKPSQDLGAMADRWTLWVYTTRCVHEGEELYWDYGINADWINATSSSSAKSSLEAL